MIDTDDHACGHALLDHEPVELAGNEDWAVTILGRCKVEGCPCRGAVGVAERPPMPHYGPSAYDVFEQRLAWNGRQVSSLGTDHVRNLERWMVRHASRLRFAYWWSMPCPAIFDEASHAYDIAWRSWEEWSASVIEMDSVEWLESTPLYRRVVAERDRRAA
jgi:hypothetical protein